MQMLDILNKEEQSIDIEDSHMIQIKEYLALMDLIMEIDLESLPEVNQKSKVTVITQPGMRYAQANAIVENLLLDAKFQELSIQERQRILERLLNEIRGRMMEDILLLEASKALGKNYKVFKLQFNSGEFDMVIRDKINNTCAIYEIKHSKEYVSEQGRHLMDENKIALTTPRYGSLVGRYVLYLGENMDCEEGIAYRNAQEFLKSLPNISLNSGLENTILEDEAQGMMPRM
jgi:hypothetical protein